MTYFEAEQEAVRALRAAGVPDADIDAGMLLTYAGGMNRAGLLTERNSPIPDPVLMHYRELTGRRIKREPLQYILGTWEFMGLDFEVSPACLIPRQDTELLVLKAYEAYRGLNKGACCDGNKDGCAPAEPRAELNCRLLDICTGSGCVIISLAKLIADDRSRKVCFEGTDISEEALELAGRNAARHGTDIHFHGSDMFGTLDCEGAEYDIITANPPYIETDEIKKLNPELWEYEPMVALDGGKDGLRPYRTIAEEAPAHLKPDGVLLMEIGDTQGQQVKALMEQAGFGQVTIHKDLAGLDRVVECRGKASLTPKL